LTLRQGEEELALEFKNNVFDEKISEKARSANSKKALKKAKDENDAGNDSISEIIDVLRASSLVKEKKQAPLSHISAFHFTRDAFYHGDWTQVSMLARGLLDISTSRLGIPG